MREKMRQAQHIQAGKFDLKNSVGGIIDVEFLVQYLVLLHAPQHPCLTQNIGNIGLLKLLAQLHIIDVEMAENVASAYREFRHTQHKLKLQGETQLYVESGTMRTPVSYTHLDVYKRQNNGFVYYKTYHIKVVYLNP